MSEKAIRAARSGEAAHQSRLAALEDAPMRRHICATPAQPPARSAVPADRELLAALERQNAILAELLCAVNGLTAAALARVGNG